MQLCSDLQQNGHRDELVVVLHGYSKAADRMSAVRETIKDVLPNADVYAPQLPFARAIWRRLCLQKAEAIVAALMTTIDGIVTERANLGSRYQRVTFVGHSFGAVLARRLAITAFGEQYSPTGDRPAPFEPELAPFHQARPWANLITRVVLLAGMNRGWSVSSAMDWITTVKWSALQFIGETILRGKPTIFAIRRGAPFLVQTRLQWLALMSPDYGPRPDTIAVQLLGSGDDQVSPDDNVDYSVDLFGVSGGTSYFYIEVPFSTHHSVVEMGKDGPVQTEKQREIRRQKFSLALTANRAELAGECISRDQMADNLPPEPDSEVTDVVFVVHGIRDKGFWTQKIARTIKKHATKEQKFESWTESYGYFAMLPFIFRSVRQRKVEWLMDRYAEARARYPKAFFHYVGHSNGTYLAAQALQDYPAARFKHMVFAGSVVRRDYDWLKLIRTNSAAPRDAPRVATVLNYVATRDWVVALFPKGLQPLRIANLGSAGHDGFKQASSAGPVYEVKYIVGGHGAGHEEPNWNDIARFIVSGQEPAKSYPPFAKIQSRFWRSVGRLSFILFPLMVMIVAAIGVFILWSIFGQVPKLPCSAVPFLGHWSGCTARPQGNQQVWRTVGFFVYLWIVYLFVTRF